MAESSALWKCNFVTPYTLLLHLINGALRPNLLISSHPNFHVGLFKSTVNRSSFVTLLL